MEILIILLLIVLNGIFAMSEIALVSSKKVRLQHLADKGSIGAAKAIYLQENPSFFLSSIQVGITTISILSGIVGEKSLIIPMSNFFISFGIDKGLASTISSVLVIMLLTFLSVVFGEIIPKSVALHLSEKVASVIAIPMSLLAKFTAPIVWSFTFSSQLILRLLKLNNIEQAPITNEEIKELMGQGTEAGVFHESEKQLVANVLHMDEKKVQSIMTHRGEWKYIDLQADFETNRKKLIENKISRVLVIDGDINNVIGFVHIVDILNLICERKEFDLKKYADIPLYMPETVSASQVLERLKVEKKDIAIIINEYGENIGLVTATDIMSAIIGDIEGPTKEEDKDIIERDDGSFLVDGLIPLDKLILELNLEEISELKDFNEVNTLSGYIMSYAAMVPHVGYKVNVEREDILLTFEVIDMDKNCVDKVLIAKKIKEKPIINYENA